MPKRYLPTNVGFILNDLRMKPKVKQTKISKDLGISREMIDAIENMRTNPSLHTFIRIIDYFNCEIRIVKKKNEEVHSVLKLIE